jgi:hypothetical protein
VAQQISTEVYRIAKARQLGIPRVGYDIWFVSEKPARSCLHNLTDLICLFIFGIFILTLLGDLYTSLGNSPRFLQALFYLFLLFICMLVSLGGPEKGEKPFKFHQAYICSYGILRLADDNSDIEVIRWEQIEKVWRRVRMSYLDNDSDKKTYLCTYKMQRSDGKLFTFEGATELKDFGTIVEEEITARLLPQVLKAYNSGTAIVFGKLALSLEGVSIRNKTFSWDEILEIEVRGDNIEVRLLGRQGWLGIPVFETSNVCVLEVLIRRYNIDNQLYRVTRGESLAPRKRLIRRNRHHRRKTSSETYS